MDVLGPVIVVVVFWVLPTWITWRLGRRKGRQGIWWGLILGWIGVLFLALNLPPKRERGASHVQ